MSTEKWKPIPGFPRHTVSDRGRVAVTRDNGNTLILAQSHRFRSPSVDLVNAGESVTRARVSELVEMAFGDDDTFESPNRVWVPPEYDVIPDWLSPKGRGYWKA